MGMNNLKILKINRRFISVLLLTSAWTTKFLRTSLISYLAFYMLNISRSAIALNLTATYDMYRLYQRVSAAWLICSAESTPHFATNLFSQRRNMWHFCAAVFVHVVVIMDYRVWFMVVIKLISDPTVESAAGSGWWGRGDVVVAVS
jgi:hypothetical protein